MNEIYTYLMNEIYIFFTGLIPTRTEIGAGAVMAIIGACLEKFLSWNEALEVLLAMMVIDYLTGVASAYLDNESLLSSKKGMRGIVKKIVILLVVSVAHLIDRAVGQTIVQIAVTWFFVGNEGLSILENAARAGVPIPSRLKEALEQMKAEKMGGGNSDKS